MAKYSIEDGSDGGGACELCGTRTEDLTTATVSGAELDLCPECVAHGDTGDRDRTQSPRDRSETSGNRTQNSRRRAAQNTARLADARTGDSTRWEREGTNYDDDQLPYLVSGYGDRTTAAREDVGVGIEDLADEHDLDANDIRAVEAGEAARAGVGGSVIAALEDRLDVTLVEE